MENTCKLILNVKVKYNEINKEISIIQLRKSFSNTMVDPLTLHNYYIPYQQVKL